MIKTRLVAAIACLGSIGLPATLCAQTSSGLRDLMINLFHDSILLAQTPGNKGIVRHTPVFDTDPTVVQVTTLINQVSSQIGSQLSIFPIGSSSGGFTYRYDPSVGTFARTTTTFGPAFAERADTLGKGKFSFGMNYLHGSYSSLDGKNLQNGDIKFYLFHQVLNPPSFVQGDVIQAKLALTLTSDTTALYTTYGVTDRLDLGLAVPIIHVNMGLTYHASILDFATHVAAPGTHVFASGQTSADFGTQGSATGVGDVLIRAKYAVLPTGPARLAAGLDLRVPSGDANNMLGSGATQTELFLITSGVAGDKLAPHLNVGYTVTGGSANVSDQINYVGGIEYAASPKVTVTGDLLGRTLRNTARITSVSIPHTFQQGDMAALESTTLDGVQATKGSLSTALAAAGVKVNPWHDLLISAHVLFSLNDAGLRSKVTPVLGFEYAF